VHGINRHRHYLGGGTHLMRNLGPAILDNTQQAALEAGTRSLLIGLDRVFKDAAERARVGDYWWAKEPFFDVTNYTMNCPTIHELVPGHHWHRYDVPECIKNWTHRCHWRPKPASQMVRADSRFTLVIDAIEEKGFRCTVHKCQVDTFLASHREAAA
jgi:hypothetical protein